MNREINFYFFNAGEGDSILIEFIENSKQEYVLIDSNMVKKNSKSVNPAYEFLVQKKAERISTIIITHMHKDHYNGIDLILDNFEIKKVVVPPFLSINTKIYNEIVNKYREEIKKILDRSSDEEVYRQCKSIAKLIHFLTNNSDIVEEARGKESILRFPGVGWTSGLIYLPLAKIKGVLHRWITSPKFEINNFPSFNDSSISFCIECFGKRILLTGDSTLSQWREHKRQMFRENISNLGIDFLKTPHHGSKHNNTEDLYGYFFDSYSTSDERHIVISADGIRNPDPDIFDIIEKFKLFPHCTNLAKNCLAKNVLLFRKMDNPPPPMRPFILNYAEEMPVECQGTIKLSISKDSIQITNSTKRPCVYDMNIVS